MTGMVALMPLLQAVAPPRPARRLLTFGQVRRRLGVGRTTLWDWISDGTFPQASHSLPLKSQTQRRRWDERIVLDWIERRRAGGVA